MADNADASEARKRDSRLRRGERRKRRMVGGCVGNRASSI